MVASRRLVSFVVGVLTCLAAGALLGPVSALAAGAPVVEEESVLNVAATSATLQATINPEGSATSYTFEYGPSTSYGTSIPVSPGAIAAGTAGVQVSAHPQSLSPHTTYHFRVRAENAEGGPVYGADQTFTTQAAGGELNLLDGRQWELVSPANKHGALIEPREAGVTAYQAAEDGRGITYLASNPTGSEVEGNTLVSQIFSTRTPGGWASQDIQTPNQKPTELAVLQGEGAIYEYGAFAVNLESAIVEPVEPEGAQPLSPLATERTLYLRDNATGTYTPLVTAANIPPNTKYGYRQRGVQFVDATPDLAHVIISSPEALTTNAKQIEPSSGNPERNLYEWSAGKLQLVNILPDGEATEGGFVGLGRKGFGGSDIAHALSENGRFIVWEDGGGTVYVRDMLHRVTVLLGKAKSTLFQTASTDGTKIFFNEVTGKGYAGNLIEYDTVNNTQTDLTVPLNAGERAGVQPGGMGASEDGTYMYIVATGVLAPGGVSGEDNMYLLHETSTGWHTSYVATLSREDEHSWTPSFNSEQPWNVSEVTSRVSPNGQYVAFMSKRSLTGYDNTDAVTGTADEEVYLYAAATEHLVCASCDPTGARPVGVQDTVREGEDRLLVDKAKSWIGQTLAGSIPGWAPYYETSGIYQPRYLDDSGRLFFQSPVALVPQDTNGVEDVYEYEPTGSGSCNAAAATFDARAGGCVDLISSGTSSEESVFFDASGMGPGGEEGEDVFFTTSGKLVPSDYDNAYDVYDAHTCSAAVPCVSEPVSPPECSNGEACKPPQTPQPAIFGAPASATFHGTGDLAPAHRRAHARHAKKPNRKQRLKRALKRCGHIHARRRRTRCKRYARRHFGRRRRRAHTGRRRRHGHRGHVARRPHRHHQTRDHVHNSRHGR